jgi:hypothetical protein
LKRQKRALREQVTAFRAFDRHSGEEAHGRQVDGVTIVNPFR